MDMEPFGTMVEGEEDPSMPIKTGIPTALTTLSVLLCSLSAPAQDGCPMHLTPEEGRIAKTLQDAGMYDTLRGADESSHVISIAWHVLQKSDGTNAIDQITLDGMIDYINDVWAPKNISFQAHPIIHYIVDDSIWNNITDVDSFRSITPLENALNVYWAPVLEGGNLCGISAFTFSSLDTIAMQTSCIGYADVRGTFAHEVGHWFDLFHTFEPFYGQECVSGSNCADAGDLICDTPASFGLQFNNCVNAATCELSCTEVPGPCAGDPFYEPSTINFMSYSTPNCINEFTPGQYDRIRATAVNLRTDYLDTYLHDPCPQDITSDYTVNVDDLLELIGNFGCEDCDSDVNRDGVANISDLLQLLDGWGDCFECDSFGGCDDGNPDTRDYCIFGECYNLDCVDGEILDCNGNCAPAAWVGDGYCDDGAYSHNGVAIYFNCDEYNCDEGDCGCP